MRIAQVVYLKRFAAFHWVPYQVCVKPVEQYSIAYGTIEGRGDSSTENRVNPDKKIVKCLVLVPLQMNDGTEVDPDVVLDFQEQLFVNFRGFTNGGTVEGQYKMQDGKKAIDHTTQYWVGIEESQYPLLRSLVSELGKKLGQESMYLETTGATIDFVEPAPAKRIGDRS